mgnify:CR=1 FL=1
MNNFDDFNAYTKNSKAIPFYMAYPMGIWREGSDDARRDAEYLISLYPTDARKIQRHLEDALEYAIKIKCFLHEDKKSLVL